MTDSDVNESLLGSARTSLERDFELEQELIAEHGLTPDGGQVSGSASMWVQMARIFMRNKLAIISVVFLFVMIAMCVIVPLFYASDYWQYAVSTTNGTCFANGNNLGLHGPDLHNLLGCTKGYDDFGLLFYAGRYSLSIGFLAAVVNMTLGVAWGIFAGFRGGKIDAGMMRIIDVFLSIPGLYLLILFITVYGQNLWAIVWVLGFTGWFGVSRLMRSEAQVLREREYVQASTSMGASRSRIMWKHILPNGASTMITAGTFAVGDAILALAALGFLGLGLVPPQFDWGSMIQQAVGYFDIGDWWTLWPVAIAFILVVLATNYIGDALRDSFDVRLQQR